MSIPIACINSEPNRSFFHSGGMDYLSMAKHMEKRKSKIRRSIAASGYSFSDGSQQSSDLVDAYHGEMHFGPDPASVNALNVAWSEIMHEQQECFIQHNKKQPYALCELIVEFLFERLRTPGVKGLEGIDVGVNDVVVVPYSSTQLLISAFHARPKKNRHQVLCPQGFYKGAAKLAAAAGVSIKTIPVDLHNDGVIVPQVLDNYLTRHHRETALLWLTMPGNPLIANHSVEQLEAIASIIVKYDMDVFIDMAFDKILPDGEYVPLPNVRVKDDSGQYQTLYERCFCVTGNSKGLGATGPWKLGAGVCGNRQWREDTLGLVTAVTFQRETTHLIHTGVNAVSRKYLENNQQSFKRQQYQLGQMIREVNAELKDEVFTSIGNPVYTPFHCLALHDHYLHKAGLADSWQLADFFLAGAGIESVELDLVGIRKPGVRLNVMSPRINGHKSPDNIYPLFNRLKELMKEVQQGLGYMEALKRIGVTDMVGLQLL